MKAKDYKKLQDIHKAYEKIVKKFTEVIESEKEQPDEFLTERADRLSVRDEIQEMYLDAVSEEIWLKNKLNAYKELVK